jgi:hypothetical protein
VNGNCPVVAIFAREISGPVTSLVKKVDEATVKNSNSDMVSYVVFLNDEEDLGKKLKQLAEKEKIKKTYFAIDNPAGPSGYHIAKDADVTVLVYVHKNVKANFAFKKGEINQKNIEKVLASLPKILPEKSDKGG